MINLQTKQLVVDTVLLLNLFSFFFFLKLLLLDGAPLPFSLACYCSWIIRLLVEYGSSFFIPCVADFLGGTVWLILDETRSQDHHIIILISHSTSQFRTLWSVLSNQEPYLFDNLQLEQNQPLEDLDKQTQLIKTCVVLRRIQNFCFSCTF